MGLVLNWIAQGMMVAAAAGLGLWLLPAGRARARVNVWWTVIATVIALPLVTWWSGTTSVGPSSAGVIEPLVVVPPFVWNATALAGAAWIVWFCLQSLRLSLDLRALFRARRDCRPVPALVAGRLRPSTRARLAKFNARLMESGDVRAAAVLGFGPPIIAVQPALLDQLTDAELDQVLVHEWAHVARGDALGTLVQRIVHVLAGWHPAVWFAMGRLRMEREMACDEMVVDATGSAKAYAACLTRVATLAQCSRGSYLAVAMLSSPGLTRRVMRLLARRRTPAFAPYWMMTPAALAIVVAFATGQISLVGVQLIALRSIDAQALAVHALPALPAATAPLAQTRRQTASPTQARATRTPVAAAVVAEETLAVAVETVPATAPLSSVAGNNAPEPTPAQPVTPSEMPGPQAGPDDSPTPAPAAPLAAPHITGGARDAWAAATQAGESIGISSKKGAVATAGFFTRLSKKVATSF